MGQPVDTDKESEELEKGLVEIQNGQSQLESTSISDKSAYLDVLIFKVNKKLIWLDKLDTLSGGRLNVKREQFYPMYIKLGKELTEAKAKIGGELVDEQNITVNIMSTWMGEFNRLVYDTIKTVCPEKLLEFQEVYKRKYLESKGQEVSVEAEIVDSKVIGK